MANEIESLSNSFFEKHFIFKVGNDVQEICKPFFCKSQTTYFNYIKRYHNGLKICLSNHMGWMWHFYREQLFKDLYIEKQTINTEKPCIGAITIVVWAGVANSRVAEEQSKYFNIGNGISLAFVCKDYIEYCYFGADSRNKTMTNWYINNIPVLINFTQYFKEKARDLICRAEQPQNLIAIGRNSNLINSKDIVLTENKSIKYPSPKHYCIHNNNIDVYITSREMECIRYTVKGHSSSQVGKLLNISERTVEKHLENARYKLNCSTKGELIGIIFENGLDKLLIR